MFPGFLRIQNGALCTPNPTFDVSFVGDKSSKGLISSLSERLAFLIRYESQRNDALPGVVTA